MNFGRLKGMLMGFGVEEDGGVEGVGVELVVWCLAGDGGTPTKLSTWLEMVMMGVDEGDGGGN